MRMGNLTLMVAAALLFPGCVRAPAPVNLRDTETRGPRLASPPPGATRETAGGILKKEELTLQDALRIADLINPELESERSNVDLATAALWQARLYPNPSLLIVIEDFHTGEGATFGATKRMGGVSMPLVVGGRIGAAGGLAEKEREIAAVNYLWRRRQILGDVKRAYVQVLSARRKVDLAGQTRDLARSLHDATSERFKAQTIAEMELLKVAVNLARAEADLRLAEKERAVSIVALHAAIGDINLTQERFTGDLHARFVSPTFEALRGQVLSEHPLLAAAQLEKEAGEKELDLAKAEAIPDIGVDLLAGRDSEDGTLMQGGIQIPLPIFARNQGKIAAARIRIRQAETRIAAAKNDLLLRLTEAHRTFTAAQERATAYADEILPKSQKALEQTDEGYRAGKFGYLDVLDAQRTLAETRSDYLAALVDLNLAAAELEVLTGSDVNPVP